MAEADLSKIISLIMENPSLIEQIKALTVKEGNSPEEQSIETKNEPAEGVTYTPPEAATYEEKKPFGHSRRKNLLYAIKPYVSGERSRAIETIVSIADILDMMKTR